MKKWILISVVFVVSLFAGYAPATNQLGYALRTDQFGWEEVGEVVTAISSPDGAERDYTTFHTNHVVAVSSAIIYTLPPRYNSLGLRFSMTGEALDTQIDLFASKGQDYFKRVATLSLVGGAVSGSDTTGHLTNGSVFSDTITITNETWISSLTGVDNAGGNRQASVWLDSKGYDTWAFVPVIADSITLIEISGY